MRAREFLIKEAAPTLADALRAAAAQEQQAQQPKIGQAQDPNAVKQPAGTQSSQSTVSPTNATPGGTQTPQNGIKKPMGMGQSFVSGLTKGKANSLGGVKDMAKQGAANFAANKLGLSNTVNALGAPATPAVPGTQNPADIGMTLKAGQNIDLPNVGKITITKSSPQGIELDTSQAPSLGVKKLMLNPKDLLQK
jgi:hypothetical protein